jgi:hypothetical protein
MNLGAARSTRGAWPLDTSIEPRAGLRPILGIAAAGLFVALAFSGLAPTEYDGGISASAGTFIHLGLVPYRDFWLLYGPLSGILVAAALVVAPPTIALLHALGAVTAVAQVVAGYLLARRFSPQAAAVVLSLAASAMPTFATGLAISAWGLAMPLALMAILSVVGTPNRNRLLGAGLLVGLACLSRLDVGSYALITLLMVTRSRWPLVGAGAVLLPATILALAVVPIPELWEQLIWYPVVGPREYRGMGYPGTGYTNEASLFFFVPLVILPRALIALAVIHNIVGRPDRSFVALTIFAALCQLQTLGRGDIVHLAQATTPAILLAGAFVPRARERWVARSLLIGAVAVPYLATALIAIAGAMAPTEHDVGLRVAAARAAELTRRHDPIFAGLSDNTWVFVNPLLAYYLADRPPGVMHTMYVPGVTNKVEVQQSMVRQLEDSGTNVLILDALYAGRFEPENRSREPGPDILDNYIRRTFVPLEEQRGYVISIRRGFGD